MGDRNACLIKRDRNNILRNPLIELIGFLNTEIDLLTHANENVTKMGNGSWQRSSLRSEGLQTLLYLHILRLQVLHARFTRPLIPGRPEKRNLGFTDASPRGRQTLQGSFSSVSKPMFASEYSFESSRRDLHNTLFCTALQSHKTAFVKSNLILGRTVRQERQA